MDGVSRTPEADAAFSRMFQTGAERIAAAEALASGNTALANVELKPLDLKPVPSPLLAQPAGPRSLRDAIGPSKGRMSQEEHMRRLDYILRNVQQSIFPSTVVMRDTCLGQRGIIIGGGPSLAETYNDVRYQAATNRDGIKIAAPNKSHDWMINGEREGKKWKRIPLIPDYGVMLDPAPYVVDYQTPHPDVTYLLATTLDSRVFAKFLRAQAMGMVWIPIFDGSEIEPHAERYLTDGIDRHFVSGGSTVGLRTINLLASFGLNPIDLHGFDSCYAPKSKTLYAYDKPLIINALTDYVIRSKFGRGDRMRVQSNSMMAKQVMEFADMIERLPQLIIDGKMRSLKLRVHGDGAIPWLAWKASEVMPDFIEHATPEKMAAKYGDCAFWDYVEDAPYVEKAA